MFTNHGIFFHKNNLKVSYSCSSNTKQIIKGHNKTIPRQNTPSEEKKKQNPATVGSQTIVPTLHLLQKLLNEIATFSNKKKDDRSYLTNHL